jgi:hypothetical protein
MPPIPDPRDMDNYFASVGYIGVPNRQLTDANGAVRLSDAGLCLSKPSSQVTARNLTIASHVTTPWPDGFCFTIDSEAGAGVLTIKVDSTDGDILELIGSIGSTGDRTLAGGGMATLKWNDITHKWRISGGLELT